MGSVYPTSHKKCRNSCQRKIILEELRKTTTHPTAKQLYLLVKKRLPEIGIATIYRNLDHLEKTNQVIKIRSKENEARYDGRSGTHCHLICRECNHILDLMDVQKISIKSKELKQTGFKIDPSYAEIFGTCQACCD